MNNRRVHIVGLGLNDVIFRPSREERELLSRWLIAKSRLIVSRLMLDMKNGKRQTSERPIQELVTEVLGVLRERAEDHFQTLLLNAKDERHSQQPGSPAAES